MNHTAKGVAIQQDRLTRILAPVTAVHGSEASGALLLTLNFFVLFTAYYVLKPIREGLILSLGSGAELKSYASGIMAACFVLVVSMYSGLAGRFTGRGVLTFIYLFMAAILLAFMGLYTSRFACLGIVFFIWMGMFNILTISQTWSLCADIYTTEQGTRLFPLIGFGAASGAVFGSLVASSLLGSHGIIWPMSLAALLLVLCAVLIRFVRTRAKPISHFEVDRAGASPRLLSKGSIELLLKNRYLALVAVLILLLNLVNTNSEYILGRIVSEQIKEQLSSGRAADGDAARLIGAFYARFHLSVGVLVLILQLFVVSRVIRRLGILVALLALPVLALLSYSLIFALPLLPIIRAVKIVENSANYSLNNTAREILFLPVSREEKYKAKFAVDTVFWRSGDTLSALAVVVLVGFLGLGVTAFAGLNIALTLLWILVVVKIGKFRKSQFLTDYRLRLKTLG